MLLLAPPSRRAHDVAISLRAPAGDLRAAAIVAEQAMGSSCPPDKAERVRTALLHSGRYDCRVSHCVVAPCVLENIAEALAEVSASIIVLDENGDPVRPSIEIRAQTTGGIRWVHGRRSRRT